MSTMAYRVTYRRNTAMVLSTGQLGADGTIGAGQLRNAETGAALDATNSVVKASAEDLAGGVLYAPALATWESNDPVTGARWDAVLPATLFSGANGQFKAFLRVYAIDGVTEFGEYVWTCNDGGA